MEYVIVKLPDFDNRAELKECGTGRVVAVGSLQALLAASRLFGPVRTEGYASCIRFDDAEGAE